MLANTFTFSDIFKSDFIENATSFSILDMIIALALSFVIGLFIFVIYKKTFKGIMYSASFGISLMGMTMVTTLIILAVTSNIVLSLGMVGALSIVRFRSAIKEPMDIVFIFWAISIGIVLGAGLIPLAVFGSLFIGILLMVFTNKKSAENPYILVLNIDGEDSEKDALAFIKQNVKKYLIKSKTVSKGNNIELSVEVILRDMSTQFVNEISYIDGVENAVLVSYNGDYMS